MGSGKQKRAMETQARAQERIAATQERLGSKFIEQGDEDRVREQELFEMIRPYAQGLMELGDPAKYGDMERPDVTGMIRRDYADERADITQSKNRALAEAEGFYTSSGLRRSGSMGAGLASIARGAMSDQGSARRRMQGRLTDESLAGYYDKLTRRGEDVNIGLQGANVLRGQQAVFNPQRGYGTGSGNIGAAGGTRGAAARTYEASAKLPSVWSKVGGVVGAGLSIANPATAAGGGLRQVVKKF